MLETLRLHGITVSYDAAPFAAKPADPTRPARWPVLAATACLALSLGILVLAVLGDQGQSTTLTGLGYVSGSIGVSLFVVVHRMLKLKAEQNRSYEPRHGFAKAAFVVLVLGLLVGLGNSFFLATEIAKR